MPRLRALWLALTVLSLTSCRPDPVPDPALRVEWPAYGGDPGGQRYSPLTTINRGNVSGLRRAWEWRTGEVDMDSARVGQPALPGRFEATPLMLGDTLYLSTSFNQVVALDANTGRELWRFDPKAAEWGRIGGDPHGFAHRGVAVWTGDGGRRVFINSRWRLVALDAGTGKPIASFGAAGEVDLTSGLRWPVDRYRYGNTSPPLIYGDLVIVGSAIPDNVVHDRDPPGDVQAFDVRTGRRVWRFETVPRPGQPGSETWEDGSADRAGHANVWAPFTVDTARGLVYLPVSAASNDWYGGRRKGDNLFSESLVCLDARSGKLVWHYQLVHHGIWDYDPPSQPSLMTLHVEGRRIDAVALAGKTGFVYVFDRTNGKPVWPIEERPVPASDVPGERAAATQPFPLRPPPFARQGVSDSDLVSFTPELLAQARAKLAARRSGPLFTPPSLQGTVVLPGWIGGAGWGGAAWDSASATLYVKGSNHPVMARLIAPAPDGPSATAGFILDTAESLERSIDLRLHRTGIMRFFTTSVRIPLVRPPYGTLTAYDLNRGVIRWQVPVGDMPRIRFHPELKSLALPQLGVAGPPGPLVTKGGLLFLSGGGDVFYALDAETGATLWNAPLGRLGYANPMTYRTALGRQFVLIATGVREGARLVAFALPGTPR
jgi:quinoprotein glucose dehydrogenase